METYGKILLVAMPAFLVLVLFEKAYGVWKGKDTVRNLDMVSSLSSGVTNVVKDVLGLSIGIISYSWMAEHWAVVHVTESWLVYIIAFLVLDFSGYWVHRIAHQYNFFWNNHIIHHSSEEFNLACALRQSISVFVRIFTFLLLPAAIVGVPGQVIAVVAPIHLFAQFWYHTQHIGKMGWLEKIIVTPSHHRVHHAINPEYLDKNYGQIFILWDKWFGTYQEEKAEIPCVYGITRPVHTWNPIKINFQHLATLLRDAWYTHSIKDKLRIWLMPTGWRPSDVVNRFSIHKISDVYHFEKYDTKASLFMHVWVWVQLVVLLLITSFLFGNIASINKVNPSHIYWYGLFIFIMVYAYTDLMDRNGYAWIPESLKFLLGFYFMYTQGSWFGSVPILTHFIAGYLILSWSITIYFVFQYKRESKGPELAAFSS